jgi:hypothetical protein
MGSPKVSAPPPPPPPAQDKEAMQMIDAQRTAERLRLRRMGRAGTILTEQNAYGRASTMLGG